ncbi:MAG: MBL fold metallo-hydrolase [Clostridiales bacterium]|nr:MBL fold metallo-hydrolase [Clostridiales bacterium]
MSNQRASITRLLPHLYLIDDAGESTCYVICGTERAMVIDTVNGMEDLHAIVRTLTDLPLLVVNTHGHCDHIYGNAFFEEAYIHPADLPLAAEHFAMFQEEYDKRGLKACPFREVAVGHVFDLGGLELEVVCLRGHTAGSIGLLDRQDRLLFSGDGVIPHLWAQLDESLPIAQIRDTYAALNAAHGHEFDHILTGHAQGFLDKSLLDNQLRGCEELLSGQRENDQPYHYFDGDCWQHPVTRDPLEIIVYAEEKL